MTEPASLQTPSGALHYPVYLPDATFGVVRGVDARDLQDCRVRAVVMNTYHLMQKPGATTVQALGGLHQMSAFPLPIITDSGGFQAYSLIRQSARFGKMTDNGISFRPEGSQRKFDLTPEKCVQLQFRYGSDILIALDDCTHSDDSLTEQKISVERTIRWAKRCKAEYNRLLSQHPRPVKPLLFGVVQGGSHPELRRQCADALLEIGFDGFGFGGWPLDTKGNLLTEMIALVRALIPAQYPLHALGIGHPVNVARCSALGYQIFDSAMPTRDARHGRLYTFQGQPTRQDLFQKDGWLKYVYIQDELHTKADQPIESGCDCPTCQHYSRGYLHHLQDLDDHLYYRLATMHNLRFMTRLTEKLGAGD